MRISDWSSDVCSSDLEGIVALVAVHVHQQAAPGGDFAELPHRFRAVCHGALEMRDAAHHVDPLVERALQVLRRLGIAPVAVLREGAELQVDDRKSYV